MYRIILVDDEDEVREGIKRKTDWQACGFEFIGDYDNGRDALAAIEQQRPDVIITDICMPFMDGLELTREVFERYRDVKVVIVTGYEDFDYAKQALQLKVNDYLLKPINSKEFNEFLGKMKQELDIECKQREDLSALRIQLNQSFPLLRERFLESLTASRMKREVFEKKLQHFQITLPGPTYIALVGELDTKVSENKGDDALLQFAAFNIMQEQLEQEYGGVVFQTRDDKIAAILSGPLEELEVKAQLWSEQVRSSIERYLKLTLTIGIGRKCTDLAEISKSFQEALSSLDYRFLLGKDKVISIQDLEYGNGWDHTRYTAWEKNMLAAMKTGKSHAVSGVLRDWFDELKSFSCPIDQCRSTIYQLLVSLMNFVADIGFELSTMLQGDPFAQVKHFRTLDEARAYLEELCHNMIQQLSEQRSTMASSQMQLAEAYIREQYGDENFSLNQLCNHIFMSISYFSATFKQHTGETFVEYLTRVRLEKAKELLTITNLKTYEIAARVGYGDPQYFSVIFKRNMGMTPKEFRQTNKGSGVV
ncbi:response regulator [Paenibacillus terrigena]|uniref:response regulator n=1 Tax=Paenibacillus terrigena TaxID=369333 RepID=UPI0028D00893|nr:response regulator [Paenibacillus terrigena]